MIDLVFKRDFDYRRDCIEWRLALRKSCALLCVWLSFVALSCHAQSQTHRKAASKGAVHSVLNDEFAKAGLRALKAIEGETGSMESMEGGRVGVPRETQELIDNSDAEAKTDKETALVALFNRLYEFHLQITAKMKRDYYLWKDKMDSYPATSMDAVDRASKEASNDPNVLKAKAETAGLKTKESTCSSALETILRSRTYTIFPEACSDLSITAQP